MSHPLYDVTDFTIVGPYTLRVVFDDGVEQTINLEPVLHGEMLGLLRNLQVFNQVHLDKEVRMLVWPNGPISILGRYTSGPGLWRRWPCALGHGKRPDRLPLNRTLMTQMNADKRRAEKNHQVISARQRSQRAILFGQGLRTTGFTGWPETDKQFVGIRG